MNVSNNQYIFICIKVLLFKLKLFVSRYVTETFRADAILNPEYHRIFRFFYDDDGDDDDDNDVGDDDDGNDDDDGDDAIASLFESNLMNIFMT